MLETLNGYVGAGGPIILILIGLSFISLTLIAYKVIDLWNVTKGTTMRKAALAQWDGNRDRATAEMGTGKSPADRVATYGMTQLKQRVNSQKVEAEMERRGNAEVNQMSRFLRVLEVIAMVSPLLGLLGTVLGMIQSFQELALAEGAANAGLLAGGIWQALLTTAAGLVVAIPASIAATLLSERAERGTQRIEASIGQLFALEDRNL